MTGARGIDSGDDALPGIHPIELRQGSDRSRKASDLKFGGRQSALGQRIDMQHWYRSKWTAAQYFPIQV